jgi:hypothetical protein
MRSALQSLSEAPIARGTVVCSAVWADRKTGPTRTEQVGGRQGSDHGAQTKGICWGTSGSAASLPRAAADLIDCGVRHQLHQHNAGLNHGDRRGHWGWVLHENEAHRHHQGRRHDSAMAPAPPNQGQCPFVNGSRRPAALSRRSPKSPCRADPSVGKGLWCVLAADASRSD